MTRHQARYAKFQAAGLCVRCGRRPPAKGRTRCGWCKTKVAKSRRAYEARIASEAVPHE
jgi:tRNA(Ile2) C34 agmatinyltransferase TiaS